MSTEIRLRRGIAAQWTSVNPILGPGEAGYETDTGKLKIGDGTTSWTGLSYFVGNLPGATLNDLGDVTITSAANGDFLRWNGTAWINDAVNLSTDTVGDYVTSLVAGTGVTVTNNSGEGATPTVAIGQAVATSSSVTFAQVTAPLVGNADTASTLQTARTISLSGDVSGSVSFNGSANVDIAATIQPNSVALGTDTTGNYVNDVVAGTGVTVTHTPGEGSSASIAIGQDVATNASVSFAQVSTTGDVTVGGNLTVNGTTTTLNTETLAVEDNIVLLNSNVTGSPSTNAGIEVERGDSANVVLRWNESTDSWEVTEDGSTYKNIAVGQDVETSSSVTFAAVTASTFTGNLVGNADTASQLATARTISLGGDLSGSVSFSGSTDVTLNATVVNSGVALDEVSDVVITSPAEFQSLAYDGTNWVNSYAPTVTYVRNAEATTLTTGTVVYLFGATGDHASVKRADNDSDTTSSKTIGLVAANIASGQNGPVVTRGYVDGIDLSVGYTAGDILWLGEDGAFTTTKPSAPEHLVFVGVVVRATNNGIVYVATQNGYELEELHDVKIISPQDNDFLKYNSASAIWVNDPINLGTDTVGNYMTDVLAGTNISITHTPGEGSSASIAVVGNPTFSGTASAADFRSSTFLVQPNGYVGWLSPADAYGRIYWSPSTTRTIYLPDVSGSIVTTGDTGTVTSTMIANGTITNSDISEAANIGLLKLQNAGVGGQLIVTDASGVPTYQTITGDISVNASGVAVIQANSVALGTDTTGDYVASLVAGTGVTLSNNSGENASPTIAIGQDVSSSAEVTFERLNIGGRKIAFEGDTANDYETTLDAIDPTADRTIYIPDASGTMALASASTGIIALGTDTTGDYVSSLVAGTGVSLANNSGENATPTISIGQAVATSSSVTFAQVTASVVSISVAPSSATDAATKAYVDQVTAGINWHESVAYATAAALPNSPSYVDGSADQSSGTGVGATLTATAYARLQVDGANTSTGQRILVKNQSNAVHNGVYEVTEQGSASVYWVLTRADDSDNSIAQQVKTGDAVYVINGTVNASQGFLINSTGSLSGNTIRIGTDEITWTQFTGTATFTAGTGLSTSGNTINVNTANSGRIVVNADNIDLATVNHTYSAQSASNEFVSAMLFDSYGRVTGTVISPVREASTSQTGIASFNSGQFSVTSGSVSIKSAGITSTEIATNAVTLGTQTTGDYVASLVAGTGITLTNNSGENASPTISIGQAVETTSSVTFAAVTAALTGNVTGNVTGNISGSAATAATLATARAISLSGDVTGSVSFNGSADVSIAATIAANSVALGTDTTGNYIATIAGTTDQVNVSGSGSETAAVTLSLPQNIATTSTPTFGGLTVGGTASVTSNASVTGQLTAASATVKITSPASNQTQISINANTSSSAEIFRIINNYNIGDFSSNTVMLMRDSTNMSTRSGLLFRQTSADAGLEVGPRLLIDNTSILDTPSTMNESAAASVVLYVDRHSSSSVGIVLKDSGFNNPNLFEWRDSSGNVLGLIGGNNTGYRFDALSASLNSASIGTASISTASVSGTLTVGGDLIVNGTTTTVNSTTITVDDPIFTLGGDTAPLSDDNKDRGIEFRYHSGTAASVGFMGYDDSTGRFTFLTGATNTSEVFSGTNASVEVGSLHVMSGATEGITIKAGAVNEVKATYSNAYTTITADPYGPRVTMQYASGSVGSISLTSSAGFEFNPGINNATLSGSVHYNSSASVTLPSKTFFPEEYLTVSSSVTLSSTTHRYATLEMTASAGTSVITVPADASDNFPVGSVIQIIRVGAGEVQVTASAGVTVNNALGSRLRAQWSTATLRKRAANTWLLSGDLKV